MSTLRSQAQDIVAAHADLGLAPGAAERLAALPDPSCSPDDATTVIEAARLAALALDFDAPDADLIGHAWAAQTRRAGRFDAGAWPDQLADFGLTPDLPGTAFAPCPHTLGLYAVLPDAAWVGRMARVGVPTLQLRFKSDDAAAIAREVRAAVAAVQGTRSRLFINDHWQAAIAAGAYGVHLGQDDLDHADLGAIRAAGLRLGLSSHGYAELLRAASHAPSYIALGAVFATALKTTLIPQGTARLARYARLLRDTPTVAIGGIDLERLPAVLACGVGSAAVVGAIVNVQDPEAAARALMAHWPRVGEH